MQAHVFQKLRTFVSAHRLDVYRTSQDSDFDVLAKYLHNVCQCEALYPSLHVLEITLRNSLNCTLAKYFRSDDWFDAPNSRLGPRELEAVRAAKDDLAKENKPSEPFRVVAALAFGFWTSLLDRRYEQAYWPWLLKDAFPSMPRNIRTRQTLSKRLNHIRKLRNRVFHHERVNHWPDLPQRHAEIVETIGWICPDWVRVLPAVDRLAAVHGCGSSTIRCSLGQALYPPDFTM